MEELLTKLHALPEDRQLEVLTDWIEGIDNAGEWNGIGGSMTEAAKNELMMGDYEDFHFYARANGGAEEAVTKVAQYVQEEDEDEYAQFIEDLEGKLE